MTEQTKQLAEQLSENTDYEEDTVDEEKNLDKAAAF